ncbi:TM2 domain-containing protein [uncultured Clostridium sp.]|uniref:TM2 domain-containing protein n=1 Tax=uncultured Clostridium sp. TaxID=59620 RepID=UPI0026167528|nr:TM2 domain-containing protein [uncultured Clostridium sp.]
MYCKECGEKIINEKSVICVKCGTNRGQGNNYCQECGNEVKNKNAEVCLNCGSKLQCNGIDFSKHIKGNSKPLGNSKIVAGMLGIFLGAMGLQRFYLGYKEIGLIQLGIFIIALIFFAPAILISWIWAIIDVVKIFTGKLNTVDGKILE